MTTVDARDSRVRRSSAPHRVPLRGGRAPARRRVVRPSPVSTRAGRLQVLRVAYDEDARRIALALRAVFDAAATPSLPSARARATELDAAIESGLGTVMKALDLVEAERPVRRRRVSKAASREHRQQKRFWTKQLMQLVDLRTHVAWFALDTPGLLVPAPLVDALASSPRPPLPPE